MMNKYSRDSANLTTYIDKEKIDKMSCLYDCSNCNMILENKKPEKLWRK